MEQVEVEVEHEPFPTTFGLYHLGLRARPDHLREDGRHIYAVPTLVIIMSWLPGASPPMARRRRRSPLPRRPGRTPAPLTLRTDRLERWRRRADQGATGKVQ